MRWGVAAGDSNVNNLPRGEDLATLLQLQVQLGEWARWANSQDLYGLSDALWDALNEAGRVRDQLSPPSAQRG